MFVKSNASQRKLFFPGISSRQQHVVEAGMLIPAMFMQMMPKKKKNLFCPPLSYADAKMQIATWRWATTTDLPQGRRRGTRGKKGGNSNLKMGIKEVIFRVHLAYGSRFRVRIFGQKRFSGNTFTSSQFFLPSWTIWRPLPPSLFP